MIRRYPYFLSLIYILLPFALNGMDYRIDGYVTEGDRQEIEDILSEAENTYLPKFKLDGNYRLNIYVCKDLPEFIKLTGAGSWNGGHFTNRTIYLQRLVALRHLGILKQTLHHEFIHFLTWRIAGNNCPVWLSEGLAINLTGELQQMDCIGITITETINKNDIDALIHSRDKEKARLGYCRAGLLVSLLIRQQGFEKILNDSKRK
ncbi:MAG TPA: hypothetical protein VK186_19595 [Candidatus Deferrimicrobium sp.]|nr:hypothetical protein [Candidatus Deferrimicrobium sp.]